MRAARVIHVVSAHAEGEVGDVIVGGAPPPPGQTLWEQRAWLATDGTLRALVLNEPRGGVFRHVNLLVPPKDPRADAAFLIMEPEDTPPMSGSNTICVATVLLETGLLPMLEPVTEIMLEVPAGLVRVQAACAGGKVTSVTLENVPSFATALDVPLTVPEIGHIRVDTAFGGDSFVMVDAAEIGLAIRPENARKLVETGIAITNAANAQMPFHHPERPDWTHHSFCMINDPLTQGPDGLSSTSTVAIQPGKLDRSPCGTGHSARMAVLHAKGQMRTGDTLLGRSIIGSEFHCKILGETEVGDLPAIRPEIRGRAWITGTHQHMLAPDDPWPGGYKLSDTWPMIG